MSRKSFISNRVTLEAAGLVALADLFTVAMRTALTGAASYLDALVLAPELYQQQTADERTLPLDTSKQLVPLASWSPPGYPQSCHSIVHYPQPIAPLQSFIAADNSVTLFYALCPAWTITMFVLLGAIEDWQGFGVLRMLVLATLIDVVVIERRSHMGWKGTHEISQGDLLILLSQDRWMRLQELADDLKAVTAGQWL
ncbi:hypothetical protein EDD18DRAFT_1420251 [Armillaria luteobubalina]|uniref:Uncharacterized protein n=1 Tax=Armillaria luteobubalina TaxID=153913 RepID=A0AA39PRJ9_9AGAR|nr:hypothetical protein EDD18DRAFT_1420251 [Armillaria luteobubalina]